MTRKPIELVKGGQGRSGDELSYEAMAIFWLGLAVIAAAGIGTVLKGVL